MQFQRKEPASFRTRLVAKQQNGHLGCLQMVVTDAIICLYTGFCISSWKTSWLWPESFYL